MASQRKPRFTPEEYLEMERKAEFKSEYLDGEIFAMAGARERHNLIVINVVMQLGIQLKGRPCRLYSNDMRVDVREHRLYSYPDVVALCGEPLWRDARRDNLLNPGLIIEVLSRSTAAYDRGEKFERYRRIDSFVEYVLIAQEKPHIEYFIRQPNNQWLLSEISGLAGKVHLDSIGCDLMLADVYDKVEAGPEDDGESFGLESR